MTLRRGFKAAAERQSVDLRSKLGLPSHAPASATALAEAADVTIVGADSLIEVTRLEELERIQAFAFSACTFHIDGRRFIVTNPLRSGGRRNSDIAHELAHLLLEHELAEVREIGGLYFRSCQPAEEEEATALGGTLLLPRPLLLRAASQRLSVDQVAAKYEVTPEMARYRLNATGVFRQIDAARASR